jgi:hypothetical protein
MSPTLSEKITARAAGICLYGLAPPKESTGPEELAGIVARQLERLSRMRLDGLVVYDIQDEADRTGEARPFPFLPTLDPELYAHAHLAALAVPKIVYRCVNRDSAESLAAWLDRPHLDRPDLDLSGRGRFTVLVGAPSSRSRAGLALAAAYALVRARASRVVLGGIAIAERHARRHDEHLRLLAKAEQGCQFFVSQAVYDVTATKSLISDYALAVRERGVRPVPLILTFSPCGSDRTLAFMKWLGIHFPRWLENDLRSAADPLSTSLELCVRVFHELWGYACQKGIPLGLNVESISIRKSEVEASVELMDRLREVMDRP